MPTKKGNRSVPVWAQPVVLCRENARFLRRFLAAAPGSPGKINFETPRVPTAPASALRDTVKG